LTLVVTQCSPPANEAWGEHNRHTHTDTHTHTHTHTRTRQQQTTDLLSLFVHCCHFIHTGTLTQLLSMSRGLSTLNTEQNSICVHGRVDSICDLFAVDY